MNKERLIEIIKIADKLKWMQENLSGYPLMQLSEVEKCMLAMEDDSELEKMRRWYDDEIVKEKQKEAQKK